MRHTMAKFIDIQSRQLSKELHCFGYCFVKQRAVCIINVWGYTEILPVFLPSDLELFWKTLLKWTLPHQNESLESWKIDCSLTYRYLWLSRLALSRGAGTLWQTTPQWSVFLKVPLKSNSRYPFFYIIVHNKCFRKILPNFKLLQASELAFFRPLFPRIYGRH